MHMPKHKTERGFTLLELTVAISLGLIVMGAMAGLFKAGMDSAMLLTQRAETQQNMRAAVDLMVKDISMAGAGLPSGGIQLPTGAGSNGFSTYGCDQTGACHVPGNTYPTGNYMYGVLPGYKNGVENNGIVPAAPLPAIDSSITSIYSDYNFPLWEYQVTFPVPGNGTTINLTPDPSIVPAPPAINSPGGIQVGDLIMLSNSLGTAVGEVTNLTPTSIDFADLDALNINQNGAASNNIRAISGGASTVAYRLFAVTYYLTRSRQRPAAAPHAPGQRAWIRFRSPTTSSTSSFLTTFTTRPLRPSRRISLTRWARAILPTWCRRSTSSSWVKA